MSRQADYAILARFAIAHLSAPVSTASVERQFSNARLILSDRHKWRLRGKTPEDLMISGNRKLGEEVGLARRGIP